MPTTKIPKRVKIQDNIKIPNIGMPIRLKQERSVNIMYNTKQMTCMSDIRKIIQDSLKEKGITSREARKMLGKKYER